MRISDWSSDVCSSDLVPFCVLGGRARVQGIGDVVDPLPHEARTYTLLTPPLHCSTVEVYRAWDRLGGPTGHPSGNDLEPAALAVAPPPAEWRDRLGDAPGETPTQTSSGPGREKGWPK